MADLFESNTGSYLGCMFHCSMLPFRCGSWCGFNTKKLADIADQLIDALAGKVRISGGLGENKPTLKNRLGVPREAFSGPVRVNAALFSRRFDIRLKRRGMAEAYDLLLGRKTYDIFAAHWPNAGDDNPVTQVFNKATKYVATSEPDTLKWQNSRPITGDVAQGIAELKKADGPPLGLELGDLKASTTGVIMARYRAAGDVKIGSFARET